MQRKTIIVGGGMAGMSCAFRLLAAKEDFLLVTDRLGGRVMYSKDEGINYGAYFVMGNYTHAKELVTKTARINPLTACFHNSASERFGVLSLHTLKRLPEFIRFYFVMREFSNHYEVYKRRCLQMPQKAALEADPYMAALFVEPASDFIQTHKFEKVASDYVSKFAYACTGVSTDRITAMDFLNVSMGLMVPIHQFIFDEDATAEKLNGHLRLDTITSLEVRNGRYILTGKSGETYESENVVIATPAIVTQKLINLTEIREACKLYVYHVQAELKTVYKRYALNLFPSTSEIILIAKQYDGSYLIYTREKGADLGRVCERYTVLNTVSWDQAMYVHGRAYMDQKYGDHLYVAGDHNGLGLEPAAISGIYAADQIIRAEISK